MDIDEEFDSLSLPSQKKAPAWEARAKITWGDPADEVRMWLEDANCIDPFTAERIVAIAVHERALAIRVKGVRDLVMGVLIGTSGAAVSAGTVFLVESGLIPVPAKAAILLVIVASIAIMVGVHYTWRGLARILGGAGVKGAVSDVADFL